MFEKEINSTKIDDMNDDNFMDLTEIELDKLKAIKKLIETQELEAHHNGQVPALPPIYDDSHIKPLSLSLKQS